MTRRNLISENAHVKSLETMVEIGEESRRIRLRCREPRLPSPGRSILPRLWLCDRCREFATSVTVGSRPSVCSIAIHSTVKSA